MSANAINGLRWKLTDLAVDHMIKIGCTFADLVGSIPDMLSASNPESAVEQINAAYLDVGGGWRDRDGFALEGNGTRLRYPGDPPRELIASTTLRDERVLFFNGAWIAVAQPDGSFRVACID